ncbi:MAG: HD family phosphohydrolase, partial [Bdellovibrio sp.]|nr:HD family phosphohydrolase [Bdellovibrio sp.]
MNSELVAIRSMKDKDPIQDRPFLVKDKVKGMGKNGKPFLSLLIGDKSGHIDARVWDRVDELSELFETGDIITIKGQVQVYLNRKQVIVHRIEKPNQDDFTKADFMIEGKKIDVHAYYSELIQIVNSLKSSAIKQIILDSLN